MGWRKGFTLIKGTRGTGGGRKYRLFCDGSLYERKGMKYLMFISKKEIVDEGIELNGFCLDKWVERLLKKENSRAGA